MARNDASATASRDHRADRGGQRRHRRAAVQALSCSVREHSVTNLNPVSTFVLMADSGRATAPKDELAGETVGVA